MATYYDGLNDFHTLNEHKPLQSSAQLVYLHLLQLNNRSGNMGWVQISDRDLELRTSLNKNTITEAKRFLKNRGLIDFHSDKTNPRAGTAYELKFFTLGQTVGQTVGHTVGQTADVPNIRVREDLKTKDRDDNNDNASAELDEVLEYWERDLRGGRLTFEHQSELSGWLELKGIAWLKDAMKAAADTNNNPGGISFKYLKTVVANKLKPKTAPKRGSFNGYNYKLPDTSNDPDWESYL